MIDMGKNKSNKDEKRKSLLLLSIETIVLGLLLIPPSVLSQQQQSSAQIPFLQISQPIDQAIAAPSKASTSFQPTNMTTTAAVGSGSVFKLSRANVPIDIPLRKGYKDGSEVFFITTDASDEKIATQITNETGFKVNFAPLLAKVPDDAVANFFVFKNGIKKGNQGTLGFQPNIADAQPGDANYSPLWKINTVEWKSGVSPTELKSVAQIMDAKAKGELTVTPTETYVNCPFIQWKGGSMNIREDKTITDESPYVGGQVLAIDTAKMIVTMIAHRGFGPDGKTIYYIVADATPEMPATMMGVTLVPFDEKLASSPVAVSLLQFTNGIKGSGPMGFQAGIGAANPTDSSYSPMWKISFMSWKDPPKARILETLDDIAAMQRAGMLTVTPAMGGKHVVNCPFFDPSTVFSHESKSSSF
jgi:hypothetical protein